MAKKQKNKNKKIKEKNHQKSQKTQKKPRWVLYAIVSLLTLLFSVFGYFWFPGDVYYEITETYTFEGDEPGDINLILLLPTSGANQEVLEPDITWPGEWEQRHEGRLEILTFNAQYLPGETVEAAVRYRVHLWQGSADRGLTPVTDADLLPSENIQSDHPDIITQANDLIEPDDERRTVRNIFVFTINHLERPNETQADTDSSALAAYQSGIGGSEAQTHLMTALSRAAGIPAHTVNGLAMPESFPFVPVMKTWDHPASSHTWAEVLVEGVWIMADPSLSGAFYKHDLLGWTDARHLVYDESEQFSTIYGQILAEAEKEGSWVAAMPDPMKFVAWSDLDDEGMTFTPQVTLRKVWDARWMMVFSGVVILVLLSWVSGGKRKSKVQI